MIYGMNTRIEGQSQNQGDLAALVEQLQTALDSRIPIEQAKGFVSCHRGIHVDEAFDLLREYARSHNMTLHIVCRAVLMRHLVV